MDILLIVAVSVQATVLAYLHAPRWKAFLLTLPIPFTLATLAVGRPLDATNVAGMVVLLGYTHAVRVLHYRLRMPIIVSIVLAAFGYCIAGTLLARVLPATDTAFWVSCGVVLIIGTAFYLSIGPRKEEGHRSPLPVWAKLPAIMCVVLLLLLIKRNLHGFTTMFPMVGVVAAYEARHSLWTVCRQIPVVMLTMLPMMITIRLIQGHVGMGVSLAVGWAVFLCALIPMTRSMWASESRALAAEGD